VKGRRIVKAGSTKGGFTLLELLAVMAIMAVIMGSAVVSFYGMGKGSRLRGATNTVRSAMSLARQQAILKGQTLEVQFFTTNNVSGYQVSGYRVWNVVEDYELGQTAYLPRGVTLSPANKTIEFLPTGSSNSGGTASSTIVLGQTDGPGTATMKIFHMTGLMKIDVS
jgi:prepilin-type N-terminal cleavage/methylation domain-containing protein